MQVKGYLPVEKSWLLGPREYIVDIGEVVWEAKPIRVWGCGRVKVSGDVQHLGRFIS